MSRRSLVTALLLLGMAALFIIPLVLHAGDADFAGTDNQARALIEGSDRDYTPWFDSVFPPGSAEVESGLFALQAAVGAGVLGYALGRLRSRRQLRAVVAMLDTTAAGDAADPISAPRS